MLTYFILVFMLADFNVASADEIMIKVYHPLLSLNHENILLSPCVSPQLCNAGNSIGLSILVYHLPTRSTPVLLNASSVQYAIELKEQILICLKFLLIYSTPWRMESFLVNKSTTIYQIKNSTCSSSQHNCW